MLHSNTCVGIRVAILFPVERYKILFLSNEAALSLDSVNLPLFICDFVAFYWLIYNFYFTRLLLANLLLLLMEKYEYLLTLYMADT